MQPADLDALVKEIEKCDEAPDPVLKACMTLDLIPRLLTALRAAATTAEELRKAREEIARESAAHEVTIRQRDRAEEAADDLAYAVAPVDDIGEHSNLNCPWTNALALVTPVSEVESLRTDLATARAAVAELVVGLEDVCAVQKRYYGNGTGLHLAMVDVVDEIRELLAKHRAPTTDPAQPAKEVT